MQYRRGEPGSPVCGSCGSELPPRARFCSVCGEVVCGRPASADQPRAGSVGTPLPARHAAGERKLVTVLVARVVDTESPGDRLDAEQWLALVARAFERLGPVIEHYAGTCRQLGPETLLGLFGVPVAHEDDPGRAAYAALDLLETAREYATAVQHELGVEFGLCVGVHTGPAILGAGQAGIDDQETLGEAVNVAAGLQAIARPMSALLSEQTQRLAAHLVECHDVGEVRVHGRAEPLRAYELRGPLTAAAGGSHRPRVVQRSRLAERRPLTRFVGRDLELQQLLAAWTKARRGRGQVVSVVGEAGIGKSRLLMEFKVQLAQAAARTVEGSCFAYGEVISYLPFLEIVRTLLGLAVGATEDEARRAIEEHVYRLGLEASAVAPYLREVLALGVDQELVQTLPPELMRQRTVEALKQVILTEAHHEPLVLIVEDVHWIDQPTQDVLERLVAEMVTAPLLLVLAYRPEYLQVLPEGVPHARITLSPLPHASRAELVRAVLARPHATQVPLQPLPSEASKAMVRELLGTGVPDELVQLVATRTDGNPLFVEELTRSLLECGDLLPTADGFALSRPSVEMEVPPVIQGVLLERIDRLAPDVKAVLQAASAIGRVFGQPVLAQATGRGGELEELLLQLQDLEFVYPIVLSPEPTYSFKHVLVQETVYQTLLRPTREELHGRIGQVMEALYPERREEQCELLAYHYARSADPDKAVEYLDLANQKAAKANAMDVAEGYFREAMRLLDTLPVTEANQRRRISLLVNQGTVMFLLLKFPEYHELLSRFQTMAEHLADPRLLGAFYARLGWCQWWYGRFDDAIDTQTRACELCEASGNASDGGQAYVNLQWGHLFKGNFERAIAVETHICRMMDRNFYVVWYVYGCAGAVLARAYLGRWTQALEEGEKGLKAAEAFSDNNSTSIIAWALSVACTYQGDYAAATRYGELAVQKAPTPGNKVWAQGFLAWAWCRAGDTARGIPILAQIVAVQRTVRLVAGAELFAPFLGEGYWLAGDLERARQTLSEVLDAQDHIGMKFVIGSSHRLFGEVNLAINPLQLEEPLAAFHFERGIAVLQQIGAENELALAYAGYGRLLMQRGDLASAQEYLARALDILERLGTLREPERVRAALVEVQRLQVSRPSEEMSVRAETATGLPLLTRREREVAALIARGLTNHQIAEQLLIGNRTVATHVEHILEKLGFGSRIQIGVWAAEQRLRDSRAL